MSTRNERRKRARQRAREVEQATDTRGSHSRRVMEAQVIKAESRQIEKPEDDGFVDLYQNDRAIPPPLPLDSLLSIYEENAIHSACIDAKVADSVGRGWVLAVDDEDDLDEDDQARMTSEVATKLRELARPSGISGGFSALCRQLVREHDATGWGAWEVSRGNGDEIDGLYPIPPHTIRAVKGNRDLYVQVKGEQKVYFKRFGVEQNYDAKTGKETSERGDNAANEVIVLKHYSPRSPYYGIPPWVSGVPAVAEFTAIREYNVSWFESGGTGDRSIHVTATDVAVAETIADEMVEKMKESKGVGHTTLVTHGSDDTNVNVELLTPEVGKRDGQFTNRREDLVVELLIAHQTPGYRIGWAIAGTLGGEAAGEMLDSYRYGVVEPMQEAAEELLADTIFNPDLGGIDLGGYTFRFKDLDWSNFTEDIAKAEALYDRGAATPNEMREMLGEERSDDPRLDEFYVSGSRLGGGDPASVEDALDVVKHLTASLEAVVKDEAVAAPARATDTPDEPAPQPTPARKRFRWRAR